MNLQNIYQNLPSDLAEEVFETLFQSPSQGGNIKIERIVSNGHCSPDGYWYDQTQAEFVILLQGAAKLEFDGGERVDLQPGDFLTIPAHQKHRVLWTDTEQPSIWLAIHYDE